MDLSQLGKFALGDGMVWALGHRTVVQLGHFVAPVVIVGCVVLLGLMAERMGWVRSWYASPFVVGVVIASMQHGSASGYICAALSAISFNLFFVQPVMVMTWPTNEEWSAYASMFAAAFAIDRMRPKAEPKSAHSSFKGRLPFVRDRRRNDDNDQRSFWDVQPINVWIEDCRVGDEYGRLYLNRLCSCGAPLLGWIIADMVKAGRYTGIEAGFVGAIAAAIPKQGGAQVLITQDNADDLERD